MLSETKSEQMYLFLQAVIYFWRLTFKDQIILTRMKTVIDKGVEKSKPSKDQERVNDATLSVSKALSVSQ